MSLIRLGVHSVLAVPCFFTLLLNTAQSNPSVGEDDLGDLALVPYYTVEDDWMTAISIVNTSDRTQVVKFRFRRAADSLNTLDFNIVLSPQDIYSGFLTDNAGTITWRASDGTCTVPLTADGSFAMPDIWREGADRGYVEIIAMGTPISEIEPIALAAKHKAVDQLPVDCEAVASNFFANGVSGARGGVVDYQTTFQASTNAALIGENNYADSGNVLKVSYALRDLASGLEFGDNAVHIKDFLSHPSITNQQFGWLTGDLDGFDFPDLDGGVPTAQIPALGGSAERGRFEMLRELLGKDFLVNEWLENAANGALADWVVTLPGQYLMLDRPQYALAVLDEASGVTCTRANECDQRDLPVSASIQVYDREEQGLGTGVTSLEKAVNLVSFGDGSGLGSPDLTISLLGATQGWMSLALSAASGAGVCNWEPAQDGGAPLDLINMCTPVTNVGVPMIGFASSSRTVSANADANYGRIVEHSFGSSSDTGASPAISDDDSGDLALVPYYTVNGDWITGIHIVNSSESTQVVKFRFRRASDSMDALDFNIVMSPRDVYAGFLSDDASGNIRWSADDTTCTVPATTNGVLTMPGIYREGAETGYVEIIAMGQPASEAMPIAWAAKHATAAGNPSLTPRSCEMVRGNFFADGTSTRQGVENNSTTWALDRLDYDQDGSTTDEIQSTYVDSENALKVSYFIRDNASGVEFGDNAVHVKDFLSHPSITNQQFGWLSGDLDGFDFPDLDGGVPTAQITALGGSAERGRFEMLRELLGKDFLVNEWSANVANGEAVDWVVTLPGQYLMFDSPQYALSVLDEAFLALLDEASGTTCTRANGCDQRDLPVSASIQVYGREEQGPGIGAATLEKTVNVVSFGGGSVLGLSDLSISFPGVTQGWTSLALSSSPGANGVCNWEPAQDGGAPLDLINTCSPVTNDGVPMIGFAAWGVSPAANPDATYGHLIEHSFTSSLELLDTSDTDADGIPDSVDIDDDNDGVVDAADRFPRVPLNGLTDTDRDGAPDDCDSVCQVLGMTADDDDDNDGLTDDVELGLGTDPLRSDSDGDGFSDGEEVAEGTDPTAAASQPELATGLPTWLLIEASKASLK